MNNHVPEDKSVLATSIYEQIKERIMDQVCVPGSRLNIDALSAELAVSPTPIREALARLAAEKLVTFEPFKGYSVNPLLTPRQVADLMHVRHLIETDAVRLAAQRITRPDLMALEKIISVSMSGHFTSWSEGYRSFSMLDQKFHETVVAAADNIFLLDSYRSLNIHVQLGRFHPFFNEPAQCDTCDEHTVLYQALAAHDPEAAVKAIEAHLQKTEVRVFGLQDTHPYMFAG